MRYVVLAFVLFIGGVFFGYLLGLDKGLSHSDLTYSGFKTGSIFYEDTPRWWCSVREDAGTASIMATIEACGYANVHSTAGEE